MVDGTAGLLIGMAFVGDDSKGVALMEEEMGQGVTAANSVDWSGKETAAACSCDVCDCNNVWLISCVSCK